MRLKTKTFQTWIDLPDGSRWLVRELGTKKVAQLMAKHPSNPLGFMADGAVEQILDWQGVTDEAGNPVAFSKEALQMAIEQDYETIGQVTDRFSDALRRHRESIKSAERD